MSKGVDLSEWQGQVDFEELKSCGADFVILRAGFGGSIGQKDSKFEDNYNKAKKAGLNVGVYWNSYAVTVMDAKKEAEACLEVIKNKKFECPIYFWLDREQQFVKGTEHCSELVLAFCNTIETNGYMSGLHISNINKVERKILDKFALWVEEVDAVAELAAGMVRAPKVTMTNISNYPIAINTSNVDYSIAIKAKELNGYVNDATATLNDIGNIG